jgi:UDP-N-acetylmuramoyl-tripeptide--D-alanyl-D-alanine ligase
MVVTAEELVRATGGRLLHGEPGARFERTCIDSRQVSAGDLFFSIVGPRHDGHRFVSGAVAAGAAGVVVAADRPEPEVRADTVVEVEDTTRALGDLAGAVRRREGLTVVAITGSAGKTTTKEMTAAALASNGATGRNPGNLNNLWGLPLSLLNLPAEVGAAVLELGMSAPGEIARLTEIADPDVGVITNVGAAHLEFFDDVDAIAHAKGELFERMRPEATAVVNADDGRVEALGRRRGGTVVTFSAEGRDADLKAADVEEDLVAGTGFALEGKRVRLHAPGRNAVANALASVAAAGAAGIPRDRALEAVATVRPLPGRGVVERLGRGVVLVDETYNANPPAVESVLAALESTEWKGRKVLALGDMLELGADSRALHRDVGLRAAVAGLSLLVAVGPLAAEAAAAASARGVATAEFAGSAEAAEAAAGLIADGDLVVAKGSRGAAMERFADAVRRIAVEVA